MQEARPCAAAPPWPIFLSLSPSQAGARSIVMRKQSSPRRHKQKMRFLGVALGLVSLLLAPARTGRTDPPSPTKPVGKTIGSGSAETPFLFGCDWPVNGSPA